MDIVLCFDAIKLSSVLAIGPVDAVVSETKGFVLKLLGNSRLSFF